MSVRVRALVLLTVRAAAFPLMVSADEPIDLDRWHEELIEAAGIGDVDDAAAVGRDRGLALIDHAAAHGRADHHWHRVLATGSPAILRGLADDLVERWEDEVGELDLWDGAQAVERHARLEA